MLIVCPQPQKEVQEVEKYDALWPLTRIRTKRCALIYATFFKKYFVGWVCHLNYKFEVTVTIVSAVQIS